MHYFNINILGPVRILFSKEIHMYTNLDKIVQLQFMCFETTFNFNLQEWYIENTFAKQVTK